MKKAVLMTGDQIRSEIAARGLSYPQVAQLLNAAGFTRSRGGAWSDDAISQVVSGHLKPTPEFIKGLSQVLDIRDLPQPAIPSFLAVKESTAEYKPGMAKAILVGSIGQGGLNAQMENRKVARVPEFAAHCVCSQILDNDFAPIFETGDVVLINMSVAVPLTGKAYALLDTTDGKGLYGIVVREKGVASFKLTDGTIKELSSVTIEGRIDGIMPQWVEGAVNVRFNDQGYDFDNW